MANAPFSTVGGYGGNASLVLDPNTGQASALVDTADGFPTLHPWLNANGSLTPFVIDPVPVVASIGMPEINAILVELRVISALLHMQLGTLAPDLQFMRADEAWNTSNPNPAAPFTAPNAAFAM
jgi:hypothetical protein